MTTVRSPIVICPRITDAAHDEHQRRADTVTAVTQEEKQRLSCHVSDPLVHCPIAPLPYLAVLRRTRVQALDKPDRRERLLQAPDQLLPQFLHPSSRLSSLDM